jgi:predicted Rossmann fold nucleotide-binding protein DprA/Smf involved in DNA uptake
LFTYGFSPKQIEFILENKIKYNIADIKKKLEQREVEIITIKDKNYPELLKQIPNPPFLFYLR